MDWILKLSWLALVLLHVPPAAVVVSPGLLKSLYGLPPDHDLSLLLLHRGVLFLAVALICLLAAWVPAARPGAFLVAAVSMLGFLLLYAQAGFPAGPLRGIALADAAGLLPLAVAAFGLLAPQSS